jgi:hypothetical protein
MFKRIFSTLFILTLFITNAASALNDVPSELPIPSLPAGSQLFRATIKVQNPGQSVQQETFTSNKSIEQIIDQFKDDSLENHFPGFNKDTSLISGAINLRGVNVTAVVTNDGNGIRTLKFCIQGSDCQVFQQSISSVLASAHKNLKDIISPISTKNVWDQLIDFLKGQGGTAILQDLADDWVSKTSIDPVAGNPNSLMADLVTQNFNFAANGIVNNGDVSGLDLFSVSPSYYHVTNNGYSVTDANLPLQWSHYFNQDNALFVAMPINYSKVESATAYSLSLGLGYSHVFIRNAYLTWALTPSIFAGVVGSLDLGSGTLMYDGALASRLATPLTDKLTLGLTDDVSYLKTAKVKIGEVETPYDLNNTITQNGLDLTYQFHKMMSVGGYYTLTNVISGQKWFIPSYNEVGVKFAKQTDYKSAMYDHITVNLGYTFGAHNYNGFLAAFGFNF